MLGIPEDFKMLLFVFGAHALTLEPSADWLPDKWICVACTGGKPLSAFQRLLCMHGPLQLSAQVDDACTCICTSAAGKLVRTETASFVAAPACGVTGECRGDTVVRHAAASGALPPNFKVAAADAFVPDLVAASDVVLGKVRL